MHGSLGLQVFPKKLDFDDTVDETNSGDHDGSSNSPQRKSLVETSDNVCVCLHGVFDNTIYATHVF